MADQSTRDKLFHELIKVSFAELHDYAPIIKLHRGSFSVFKFDPKQAIMTDFTQKMGEVSEQIKEF